MIRVRLLPRFGRRSDDRSGLLKRVGSFMQVFGLSLIAIGAGLVFVPAGLITAGVFSVLIGLSLERG